MDLYSDHFLQLIQSCEKAGVLYLIAGYSEIMTDSSMYAGLMSSLPGLESADFDEHYTMASIVEIEGVTVRFLHYNHLIQNEQATGLPKDLIDLAGLQAIHNRTNL